MTCKEKLAIEHPKHVDRRFIADCIGCPIDYGYLDDPEYCACNDDTCTTCWDRELPEHPVEHDTNPYWNNIAKLADKQREKGIATYGQGIEDNPADPLTRIQYIEEELIDALMYLEWLKESLHGTE